MLESLTSFLLSEGFKWGLPVMLGKITDPLWPDPGSSIEKRIEVEIYGEKVRLMHSMILHKQYLVSKLVDKIFIVSPNIRIEKKERSKTGRHLYEFTQVDFEARDYKMEDIMDLVERMLTYTFASIKSKLGREIKEVTGEKVKVFETPYKVYDREELESKYGKDWEEVLPKEIKEPVWVTNLPREFYDYEGEMGWRNYDLYLPRIGEVLSGAEREWQYEKVLKKMERDGVRKEQYERFLELLKRREIKPSAGGGMGVERVLAYLLKAKHIGDVQPFPRVPGKVEWF